MTERVNFLGIPIEGDINRSSRRSAPQRSIEEFGPILQAVLDDPLFAVVGWTQYTPYFNDGDSCEFSVHTPWFATVHESEDAQEEAQYDDALTVGYGKHPTLGHTPYSYRVLRRQGREDAYVGNHPKSYARAVALHDAMESGAFDDVLLDAFGDHAQVKVTREKIEVDGYDHD